MNREFLKTVLSAKGTVNNKKAEFFKGIMEPLRNKLIKAGYKPSEFNRPFGKEEDYTPDDIYYWYITFDIPSTTEEGSELSLGFQPTHNGKIRVFAETFFKYDNKISSGSRDEKVVSEIKNVEDFIQTIKEDLDFDVEYDEDDED